ncbi:ubiquinone/menaquinone biosynthesis methyltransferase [compost metagenome]
MQTNTENVSEAFSQQSLVFDTIYRENLLSEYMRQQFRTELLRTLKKDAHILELNCGTGMDTVFFAEQGYKIFAIDNAEGMLQQLRHKVHTLQLRDRIEVQRCNFEHLETLQPRKFDHIYSNFSGLNCTEHLDKVLQSFRPLLNPGGKVSLVIMPRICPWENIMALKGKWKTAFRRFKKNGTIAHIEGVHFKTWYYNPSYVIRTLKPDFKLLSLKGICITVPPPFIENFVERYPRWFSVLQGIDRRIAHWYPFTWCCDQYMITLELK